MTGAAEPRAVANKVPRLCGGEGDLTGGVLADLGLQIQFLEFDSMSHVLTSEREHHRLAFLQRDLGRRIATSPGHNFDPPRSLCCRRGRRESHAARRQSAANYRLRYSSNLH